MVALTETWAGDDTPFWLEALREFRRRTGDERPASDLPASELSRILLDAQKRKEASQHEA